MKVLLAESAQQYDAALSEWQRRLIPLQEALDAYTALGIATVPTVNELAELQESPRSFLLKMMSNRQPITLTGGIPVTPEKAYELMQKPAGAEEFVTLVQTLFPANVSFYLSNRVAVEECELVTGQLQIKQSTKDTLREQSRIYATTQAQVDEWGQLQIIAQALNTIRQLPRYGARFNATLYLESALQATENLEDSRPATPRASYVVSAVKY